MSSRHMLTALVCLAVTTPTIAQTAPEAGHREPVLTVLGKGSYEVKPDLARFHVTVTTEGRTLDGAAKSHKERVTRALALLQSLRADGIEIEKSSFKIDERRVRRPVTEAGVRQGQKPEIVIEGYLAKTTFSLKASSLDNLNSTVSKIAESGLFGIDALRYQVLQERAALNQARRAAMLDAREQAHAYVEPVNLNLDQIVAITDGEAEPVTGYADMPLRSPLKSYSYAVQIVPPATVEFTATVNVTWRIAPR